MIDYRAKVAEILRSPEIRKSLLGMLENAPAQTYTRDIEHALESESAAVLAELCKEVSVETRARWNAAEREDKRDELQEKISMLQRHLAEYPEPVLEKYVAELQAELRALGGADDA